MNNRAAPLCFSWTTTLFSWTSARDNSKCVDSPLLPMQLAVQFWHIYAGLYEAPSHDLSRVWPWYQGVHTTVSILATSITWRQSIHWQNLLLPPFHNVVPIDFYKSQTLPTLTKCIEKIVYIYNTKHVYFENITHDVSNEMHLVF